MKQQNEELSLATKVKIVGSMALVSALVVVSTGVGVALQKENKLQAAELAKTQLANVEAMRTSFPEYKNTEQFKERAKMAITKISVEDLPTTITAGLDESVDHEDDCTNLPSGTWNVKRYSGSTIASSGDKNGWDVSEGGAISIPLAAEYGKYQASYVTNELCPSTFRQRYTYVFKITPPCPTSVTLTSN